MSVSKGMSASRSAKGSNKIAAKQQFKRGVKVEMEHTASKAEAAKIARDHLKEFKAKANKPNYYTELDKMEKKLKKSRGNR